MEEVVQKVEDEFFKTNFAYNQSNQFFDTIK
jgi:hypothetical protein